MEKLNREIRETINIWLKIASVFRCCWLRLEDPYFGLVGTASSVDVSVRTPVLIVLRCLFKLARRATFLKKVLPSGLLLIFAWCCLLFVIHARLCIRPAATAAMYFLSSIFLFSLAFSFLRSLLSGSLLF